MVNQLLRRLRQTPVQTVTESDYSLLCVQFINEAKREVEDTWQWLSLRTTITVNTELGYSQYILQGVGNSRFKVIEVINNTSDYYLEIMNTKELTKRFMFGNPESGQPRYYGFNGSDVNNNPIVDVYPIPDAAYEINFNVVIPQNDLENNEDVIKVPHHLVFLGAYVKALVERGEDNSSGYQVALASYKEAVLANVAQEDAMTPGETDWYAV